MVGKKEIVELKRKLADISSAAAFTVTIKENEVKVDKHDWDRLMDTIYGDILLTNEEVDALPKLAKENRVKRPKSADNPDGYELPELPLEYACSVRCSRCGKRVSNVVKSLIPEGLVVRAFVECPECVEKSLEPKPDESRLLTNEEVDALPKPIPLGDGGYDLSSFVNALKIAQDAKTASVLKEYEQARVERIFQEIENLSLMLLRFDVGSNSYTERPLKNTVEWQALKKQEGIR